MITTPTCPGKRVRLPMAELGKVTKQEDVWLARNDALKALFEGADPQQYATAFDGIDPTAARLVCKRGVVRERWGKEYRADLAERERFERDDARERELTRTAQERWREQGQERGRGEDRSL